MCFAIKHVSIVFLLRHANKTVSVAVVCLDILDRRLFLSLGVLDWVAEYVILLRNQDQT